MRNSIVCLALLAPALILSAAQQGTPAGEKANKLYEEGRAALQGSEKNRSEAQALDKIRRSAEMGYVPAQTAMAYFAENGVLVTRESGQAAMWYRRAAEQGDSLAQWNLGRLHLTGSGVPRDRAAAERWLRRGADQNDPFSQYLLGLSRLEQDAASAVSWFRKSAEQGLPQAQARLGELLLEGRGVRKDPLEAYIWLLLSSEAGNDRAAAGLSGLEAELGTTQVEQAKERARSLQQRVRRSIVARGCTGWAGESDEIPSAPPPEIQDHCR